MIQKMRSKNWSAKAFLKEESGSLLFLVQNKSRGCIPSLIQGLSLIVLLSAQQGLVAVVRRKEVWLG